MIVTLSFSAPPSGFCQSHLSSISISVSVWVSSGSSGGSGFWVPVLSGVRFFRCSVGFWVQVQPLVR